MIRRLYAELDKLTTEQLMSSIDFGVVKALKFATQRPEGWQSEIEAIEKTIKILKSEIRKRLQNEIH